MTGPNLAYAPADVLIAAIRIKLAFDAGTIGFAEADDRLSQLRHQVTASPSHFGPGLEADRAYGLAELSGEVTRLPDLDALDMPVVYERSDEVTKSHGCVAADLSADDGFCGSPEFCDCARYALQRDDAQARKLEQDPPSLQSRAQAWCLDRPSGTVVFIGSKLAAYAAAAPMRSGGKTELMINGPYEIQFEQDPLSRGAEPGHDMGPGPGYTVVESVAPDWMRVLTLRTGPGGPESGFEVTYKDNGIFLGDVLRKEDGFYDFWPETKGGYWSAYVLLALGNMLDALNEPWQRQIDNDPALNGPGRAI
jgi:hypothetical protein